MSALHPPGGGATGYAPSHSDVELLAKAIFLSDFPGHPMTGEPGFLDEYRDNARAALRALAGAGRLLDPGDDVHDLCGVIARLVRLTPIGSPLERVARAAYRAALDEANDEQWRTRLQSTPEEAER